MTQALVTVAVPFAGARAGAVNALLDTLGNPAHGAVADALNQEGFVHFMSITVVHEDPVATAHLLIEVSADGSASGALRRLARTIGLALLDVLHAAGIDVPVHALARYLEANRLDVGVGWSQVAGVLFCGTPGMSVPRILKERDLAAEIERWVAENPAAPGESALETLERVRAHVFQNVDLKETFVADPVPPGAGRPVLEALPLLALSLFRHLLWPLFAVAALGALASWLVLGREPHQALWDGAAILGLEGLVAVPVLWLGYRRLRWLEERDAPDDRNPRAQDVEAFMRLENHTRQNHLAAVSVMKSGLLRRIILRFVLWGVQAQATYVARPGFLSGIGSIHFARWVRLPGTNKLLFFSNYGGSWASYLEDFIAHAAEGLSAIWSNTRGFPRTRGLVRGGATDSERFKRWGRRQQIPTRFWYTAYPDLTTFRIRANAQIRHGFAGVSTEAAAAEWLRLVGFAAAPAGTVDTAEIPTLAFGGLKPLNYAHCLIVRLGAQKGREWLRQVAPDLRYGEERPALHALVAGLSASGVRKVVPDPRVLDGFPSAFVHGMAAPWRARVLGDTGASAPDNWSWGKWGDEADAVLMVYADEPEVLKREVDRRLQQLADHGHSLMHQVVLDKLPEKGGAVREPFGFIDGISQPIMRGTRKWVVQRNAINQVEPGELVLGYPDNLGTVAPTPRYNGRDIGRNGTFLVVRQLEQNVDAFNAYLEKVAAQIQHGGRIPDEVSSPDELREWIAAKMVGRWREDGSSLVRHPLPPTHKARGVTHAGDNDFLFGKEDPHGARCPLGSHIRRANPRESFEPGSPVQIGITNRHRIFRVGRVYSPQNGWQKPGLLFMCVNADIEDQFEFLQQTWVLGRSFHAMADEVDPVLAGPMSAAGNAITIPTARGPLRLPALAGLHPFITVLGGGYFFMPGKSALELLVR